MQSGGGATMHLGGGATARPPQVPMTGRPEGHAPLLRVCRPAMGLAENAPQRSTQGQYLGDGTCPSQPPAGTWLPRAGSR